MIDNSRSLQELDAVVEELHKEFLLRAETATENSSNPSAG